MKLFARAPRIGRHHIHGTWAEGNHGASEDDRLTFEMAVADFSFLLARGEQLTGAQWMNRIEQAYGGNDRTEACMRAIERVMLTRHFPSPAVLPSLLVRPPEGPAGQGSAQEQLVSLAELASFCGYSSAMTFKGRMNWGQGSPGAGTFPPGEDLSARTLEASLANFVRSLTEAGWELSESAPLFLARPAPLVNPAAAVQPHEQILHPRLVGCRIPDSLVLQLLEGLNEQAEARPLERVHG